MEHLRQLAGVSERAISELAGLPATHFTTCVARLRDPSRESADIELGTLLKYRELFDVELNWLVRGTGVAPTPKKVKAAIAAARATPSKAVA